VIQLGAISTQKNIMKSLKKYYQIIGIILLLFPRCLYAIGEITLKSINNDTLDIALKAIEINGNYISPKNGIDTIEAKNLIVNKFKKDGTKGDINSAIKLIEITTNEIWSNIGGQLYQVDVEYAWINAVILIKDNNVFTILNGMPTKNIFIADIDNDSIYEIYTNRYIGSGIISEEILGYNVVTNENYQLAMRMEKDFQLYVEDGILKVKIYKYPHEVNDSFTSKKIILKKEENKNELSFE